MAVNVNHTRKIFGQGDTQISALNDISFSINTGEFVVIMGPSGAGKSTLIHILAGLEDPDSGTVAIDNLNLNNLSDTEKCDLRRNKIGLILQFFNLHPQLTVEENIELPLMISGIHKSQRKDRIEKTLLLVAMVSRRNHYPSELSGGEQQRAAIARALVINPKIILADEPTGELDTETGSEIINLLHELNKKEGVTVLQVTHDEAFLRLGDRLILMEDGNIIKDQLLIRKNQLVSPSFSIQTELEEF